MKYTIGIDPGTHTGLAVRNLETDELQLFTMKIHTALDFVRERKEEIKVLVIENPNLWTYFKDTKNARSRLQGTGSIKRDFSIWEYFLTEHKIKFRTTRPDKQRNQLAEHTEIFARMTGYKERSSHHARVAALLIEGVKK